MTHSILFIAACLALSLVGLRRPVVTATVAVAFYVFVPLASSQLVVGVALGQLALLHPSTLLVLIQLAMSLLLDGRRFFSALGSVPLMTVAVGLFMTLAVFSTYPVTGLGGLTIVLHQVLAPFGVFLLVQQLDTRAARRLVQAFLAFCAVQALLVVLVAIGVVGQPYAATLRATFSWYALDAAGGRALGTADHPLVLGMLLALAIPFVTVLQRVWLQVALSGLFVLGVVLAQARTSLALAVVAVAALVIRSSLSRRARGALVVGLLIAGAFAVSSSLTAGLSERLRDDGGSADGRLRAWSNAFDLWGSNLTLGSGPGASAQAAFAAGLGTSFENPLLMYAVEYGVLGTLALFIGMFVVLRHRAGTSSAVSGATVAALVAIVAVHSFSSLATINNSGGLLFLCLALASLRTSTADGTDDDALQDTWRDSSRTRPVDRTLAPR
ncbi:O-antigen ligase family protein [Frigoribacterium salinisoli]